MSSNAEEAPSDPKGEGVLFAGRSRSGFVVFWLWFVSLYFVLAPLACWLDWANGGNPLGKVTFVISGGAFGPLSGLMLDFDVEHFRPIENQALRELLFILPTAIPWGLYLLALWKTRWGRAPWWVHVLVLLAWHFTGLMTAAFAAIKYT